MKQAWRQAHVLGVALGIKIKPLLIFTGGRVQEDHVGKQQVLPLSGFVPYLTSVTERELEYEDARRILEILDRRCR